MPSPRSGSALTALALAALAAAACQPTSTPPAGTPPATVSVPSLPAWVADTAVIDLTHALGPDSLYWPTGAPFEHRRDAWGRTPGGYWYASASFSSPEHLGTHLDAPIHFAEDGWTSADIPVGRLFAAGALVDISTRANQGEEVVLTPDDVTAWEKANGVVPRGAILLVRTGWSTKWPDWNAYYGSQTPKDVASLRFPGVSSAAARVLVERGVVGVGIDTASIDPGSSTTFEAHQVLAAGNIFNLENLTGLNQLPALGFAVMALPMKIEGGTGGPARVVALVPKN